MEMQARLAVDRRAFLNKAAAGTLVTSPAVSLLLNASAYAQAGPGLYTAGTGGDPGGGTGGDPGGMEIEQCDRATVRQVTGYQIDCLEQCPNGFFHEQCVTGSGCSNAAFECSCANVQQDGFCIDECDDDRINVGGVCITGGGPG